MALSWAYSSTARRAASLLAVMVLLVWTGRGSRARFRFIHSLKHAEPAPVQHVLARHLVYAVFLQFAVDFAFQVLLVRLGERSYPAWLGLLAEPRIRHIGRCFLWRLVSFRRLMRL